MAVSVVSSRQPEQSISKCASEKSSFTSAEKQCLGGLIGVYCCCKHTRMHARMLITHILIIMEYTNLPVSMEQILECHLQL